MGPSHLFKLLTPTDPIRIENGHQNHDQQDAKENIENCPGKKAIDEDDEPTQNPKSARQTVGFIPIFLIVQGPGQADADCIILLGLRPIIAHDQNNNPHHN